LCCGSVIAGAPAATAEALMRSRYSAYVKRA
jgi:SEC-C motif-containing protein